MTGSTRAPSASRRAGACGGGWACTLSRAASAVHLRGLALIAAGLTLALAIGAPGSAAAAPGASGAAVQRVPHGLRTTTHGQTVIVLSGSHAERGEALGRLAGREIVTLVRDYALQLLPPARHAALRLAFPGVYRVPPAIRAEAEGVVRGIAAAGVSLDVRALGRALDADDLLVLTVIPDAGAFGCSSLSAWGPATAADPQLGGAPLIGRNLDFDLPPGTRPAVRAAQAVVVHVPSEPDEQPWLAVGFLGFLGALSGFDTAGVGAFLNLDLGAPRPALAALVGRGNLPTALAVRLGLERRDPDGDGRKTPEDVVAAFRAAPQVGAVLVHVLGPTPPALVIEADAGGVVVRRPLPQESTLVATNHARLHRAARPCQRYARLREAASVDPEGLARLLDAVAFRTGYVRTLESLLFEPRAGRIGVRFLGHAGHAAGAPVVWHVLRDWLAAPP